MAILFIGLFLSVSRGTYHPSFTSFSGFGSATFADVADDSSDYFGNVAERLAAIYQDLMAPVRIARAMSSSSE